MYVRKYGRTEIEKYEPYNSEKENVYSFEAFLKYIATSADMLNFDYHWQTMHFQCMPCEMGYDIVTMQETSASDAVFVLEQNQVIVPISVFISDYILAKTNQGCHHEIRLD